MSLISIAKLLGVSDVTVGNYFKKHDILPRVHNCSGGENELASELAKYVDVVQSNRTLIAPFELDIVIPTHKLAIEYCGLYWHGEVHKKSSYHRDKLRLCEEVGYRLITIYEDEWVENQQLVFQKILHILKMDRSKKIPARKCHIDVVDPKQKSQFHSSHHIQGSSKATISYGLYNGPELVAVVSMVQRAAHWELARYSTSCQVVGGFTKLMKHFVSNHQPHQVVTFVDLRWSVGELYSATGWTLDRTIPPDYYWCRGNQRKHKFSFRHAAIKHKFPNYDSSVTEVVNCHSHGWKRIYDCGKHRYVLCLEKV
jgi:very-short-patch-repair endonuclease